MVARRGETYVKKITATPSAINKAKKDRSKLHAQNAMIETFGSEEAAWVHFG